MGLKPNLIRYIFCRALENRLPQALVKKTKLVKGWLIVIMRTLNFGSAKRLNAATIFPYLKSLIDNNKSKFKDLKEFHGLQQERWSKEAKS